MAFCSKCGASINDGTKFCPSCGAAVNNQNQEHCKGNYSSDMGYDERSDAEQNKAMGILAYIGVLVIVPLLAAPKSRFARYHANQSLINIILCVGYSIVQSIFVALLSIIAYYPSYVIGRILGFATYAFLALAIIGIVNAANGEMKPLPVVGKLFTILK